MKSILLTLLFPFLLGAQVTKPGLTTVAPDLIAGLDLHPALVYARSGQREIAFDLYRPKNAATPLPAIVCIHGGGWFKGERSNMTPLAQSLAARGYVTATISYRLSGEAKFPAAIEDCKAAIRFLRANADRFGIRSDAIGVTGLSAGGHLAALLSTSSGVKKLEGNGGHAQQLSRVQACMAMGAQSDLQSDRIRALSRQPQDPFYCPFLGGDAINTPEVYALASPRHHLDRGDPPLAFMAGDGDYESTHAKKTRRDLMALGIATSLTLIPRAPHAFLVGQRTFDVCVNACDDFFTLHLKQSGQPLVECDLPAIFAAGANWQLIGGGYAGCEGAQWIGDTLHFAAHHDHFAFQWNAATGLKPWRGDSPEATSFRSDGAGGFYVVEQTTRQLTRWNAQGERVEVLADAFEGNKLNRPNDCVVKSDGSVWLTDPDFLFHQRLQDKKELPGQFVFRFDPKTKTLTKAAEGFDKPNGIAFSPDEKHLFISDSGMPNVFRFPVNADGTLGPHEVFATFTEKGLDGLALSPQGHLWVCTKDGIRITALDGKALGLMKTPGKPTSIAFGPEGRLAVTTREACCVTKLQYPISLRHHDSIRPPRRSFLKTAFAAPAIVGLNSIVCAQTANEGKLGVAICGLGGFSKQSSAPELPQAKNVYFAGAITGDTAKGRKWAARYGFPEKNILSYAEMAKLAEAKDIAIVHVVMPNSLHAEHSIAAAKAGKHVMCEKPMATSAAQCEAMIAAAQAANVYLGVNYRLHWEPHHVKAIEALRGGAVGDLSKDNYEFSWGYAAALTGPNKDMIKRWLLDPKLAGGGAMFDTGVYPVQAACCLTGKVSVSVRAFPATRHKDLFPAGAAETMSFELLFDDGFQALCRASYGTSFHPCTTLGPKGSVEILPGDKGSVYGQSGGNKPNPKRLVVNKKEVPAEDTLLLDVFAKAITNKTPFKADGAMGLRDIRIVEAIYASAKQRRSQREGEAVNHAPMELTE